MNNTISLKGKLLNKEFSHQSNGNDYEKAFVEVTDGNDVYTIPIKFKKDTCKYNNGDEVNILGNLRNYNKSLYVFTKFIAPIDECEIPAAVYFSGTIVKVDEKWKSIIVQADNTFAPIKVSDVTNKHIGDTVGISGKLIARTFTKRDSEDKFITYEIVEL